MNDFDPSIIDIAHPGVCGRCGLRGMLLNIPSGCSLVRW